MLLIKVYNFIKSNGQLYTISRMCILITVGLNTIFNLLISCTFQDISMRALKSQV